MRSLLSPLPLAALVTLVACEPGAEFLCEIAPSLDEEGCAAVEELVLPAQLPPARGNAFGDDPAAAELGFQVFFDARFSSNLDVRCASCHLPEHFFGDSKATSDAGVGQVPRNSPTILNSAWQRWQFWDGRADSLWSQPRFALEAGNEMNYSRLEIAHRVNRTFKSGYEGVFGALPALDDEARFATSGGPGDASFDSLSEVDQQAVNRVVANLGKALEAYMREVATGPSRLDAFLAGDPGALSAQESRGLEVYAEAGCTRCHGGPLLGGETFHNIGVPAADGAEPERGRADGALTLADSLFSLSGPYADDPPGDAPSADALRAEAEAPESLGAFIAPSLRNVSLSAPYGHNGSFATLEEIVDFHLDGGGSEGFVGNVDGALVPVSLDGTDRDALLAFLRALEGEYPAAPWNDWPER
jgi:cytochrome c peroxidase